MEPVGELDQNDPDIPGHCQQHLAEVFCLRVLARFEVDLIDLADPIDQLGDVFTKARGEFFFGGRGVLDNIVQQRCDEATTVKPHLPENGRHGQGVEDISFTTSTHLPVMGFGAKQVGIVDGFDFLGIEVLLDDLEQITDQQSVLTGFRGPLPVFS